MTAANWWAQLYDERLFAALLDRKSDAEIQGTADFLIETLRLNPRDLVFDQCCGAAHVGIEMARRGYRVHGVDQAAAYVERGRWRAKQAAVEVDLAVGDAFEFVPNTAVRATYNWWTSYGYADDQTNLKMLDRAYMSLQPGGLFALDTMNVPHVLANFLPSVVTRHNELTLVRESALDIGRGLIHKTWTYFSPHEPPVEHRSHVRLYMPDQLAAQLESVGFDQVQFFGDITASALTIDSPRCIIVARRPA